ncbi:SLC39A11 [Acanthosepion pharaonis]|uniref:Zinc transporter ZIP11 n=1 Tax=Acanthosepion pharaonis TaxID=158019 RepID=A0A812AMB7_ACAPH|nr:SLC39A11 [Sepia pharaonis]
MIPGYNSITQAFLGTLFTWALTAVGSGLVFVFRSGQRKILDGSLGFAAGVMTAASYWSLLDPAIEMAQSSGFYGANGQWAFVPVAIGFALGSLFVYTADIFIPHTADSPTSIALAFDTEPKRLKDGDISAQEIQEQSGQQKDASLETSGIEGLAVGVGFGAIGKSKSATFESARNLALGIGIQNFPEGLAVSLPLRGAGLSTLKCFW